MSEEVETVDKLKSKIKNLEKENAALKKMAMEMKIKVEKYELFMEVKKNA